LSSFWLGKVSKIAIDDILHTFCQILQAFYG
jgi:hypothetical protein